MGEYCLHNADYGRFHFVNSIEYRNVPLYLRLSEYLTARGSREHVIYLQQKQRAKEARAIWAAKRKELCG